MSSEHESLEDRPAVDPEPPEEVPEPAPDAETASPGLAGEDVEAASPDLPAEAADETPSDRDGGEGEAPDAEPAAEVHFEEGTAERRETETAEAGSDDGSEPPAPEDAGVEETPPPADLDADPQADSEPGESETQAAEPPGASGEGPDDAESGSRLRLRTEDSATEDVLLSEDARIQVGQINYYGRTDSAEDRGTPQEDRQLPPPVRFERLRRIQELFVASPDYRSKKRTGFGDYEGRVFIVYGPEHAGKLTSALHLGLDLHGGDTEAVRVHVYRNQPYHMVTLFDLLDGRRLEEPAVHVFEDAFDNEVIDQAVIAASLESLNSLLEDTESYLILTTESRPEDLEDLNAEKISAQLDDLEAVFEKHLHRYSERLETVAVSEEVARLAREEWRQLGQHLRHPVQIERFCHKLSELSKQASRDQLLECARQAARIGQESTRSWFNNDLHDNERLYAMLAVLFGGVERTRLNEIYFQAVARLRTDGVTVLCDPRQIGLDDLLENIHAFESERQVEFQDRAFEDEVRRQIRNHHHLLWSILAVLLELVETFKAPRHWQFRANVGAVIGQLGLHHRVKLLATLESLVLNPSGGVVAVAGSALDQLCRNDADSRDDVCELLEQWIRSGSPDRMWAAGAAVWRIYQGLVSVPKRARPETAGASDPTLGRLFQILSLLVTRAGDFDQKVRLNAFQQLHHQVREESRRGVRHPASIQDRLRRQLETWTINNVNGVVFALRKIAWADPEKAVAELRSWLQKEGESNLRFLAYLACQKIFEDAVEGRKGQIGDRHRALLELVEPLLSATRGQDVDRSVAAMMAALRRWLRWPEWSRRIFSCFLSLANRAEPPVAARLRLELPRHWLESDSAAARRVGRALLARLQAIDGAPLWPPGAGSGLIAFDASAPALAHGAGARVARWLFRDLDPLLDMTVVRLGHRQDLVRTGEPIPDGGLQADRARPRLLLPALENLAAEPDWMILIAWGPVADLADLEAESWRKRLTIAWGGDRNQAPDDYPVFSFSRRSPTLTLEALERKLARTWPEIATAADPASWWPTLAPLLDCETDDSEAVAESLERRVGELSDVEQATGRDDPARLVTCTLLALSARDPARAVRLLDGWLSREENSRRWLMGRAAAAAVLLFYAHRDPVPAAASHECLLDLAPRLIESGRRGAEAVFLAARNWVADPSWAELLLSPDGERLAAWIDALKPADAKALERRLKKWQKELRAAPADADSRPARKLIERVRYRLALAGPKPDLSLLEGRCLGLVVLDAALAGASRRRCAELAGEVIERLGEADPEDPALVVYRLGQTLPIAVPGERPEPEDLLPHRLSSRPRLLSSVLEAHSLEQIRFILLLAGGTVLDLEDWSGSPWTGKISLYSLAGELSSAEAFTRIPVAKRSTEVDSIMRHLELKVGV